MASCRSFLVPHLEEPLLLLQPREARVLVEAIARKVLGIGRQHRLVADPPLQSIGGVERGSVGRSVVAYGGTNLGGRALPEELEGAFGRSSQNRSSTRLGE